MYEPYVVSCVRASCIAGLDIIEVAGRGLLQGVRCVLRELT